MSYIDIYNEQIYDLLADVDKKQKPAALRIRDNADRGVYAHGVTLKEIRTLSDAFRLERIFHTAKSLFHLHCKILIHL